MGALAAALAALALADGDHFAARAWNDSNGLPQNSVLAIHQARDGMLWLGTQDGVAQFDGKSFDPLFAAIRSVPGARYVRGLLEDRDGGHWIGTGDGLVLRQPGGPESEVSAIDLGYQPAAAITGMVQDGAGVVWVATSQGLTSLRGGAIHRWRVPGLRDGAFIRALLAARDGAIWIASETSTLRWQHDRWTEALELRGESVSALYEDRAGGLWYGTLAGGVGRLHPSLPVHVPPLGRAGAVFTFVEDELGTVWVGTEAGLFRVRDGALEPVKEGSPALARPVLSLLADQEQNLWVGTDGAGLVRLRRTAVSMLEPLPGDTQGVLSIDGDASGRAWLGTAGSGLFALRGRRVERRYTKADGLLEDRVMAVVDDRHGGAWVGLMHGGLQHLTSGRFETPPALRKALGPVSVLALRLDQRERLWIGTLNGGVHVFDGSTVVHLGKENGLSDQTVYALEAAAAGGMWLGTHGGLYRAGEGASAAARVLEELDGAILALHEDRDRTLWIGTYTHGLHWLRPGGGHGHAGRAQGLPDDLVFTVVEDVKNGRLWMSCNHGLFSARKEHLLALDADSTARVDVVRFGRSDGMISEEANGGSQPSSWVASDGTFWFPTVAGVVVVDAARYADLPPWPPLRVVVDEVLVDGTPVSVSGGEAPPGAGRLEVRYRATTLLAPDEVRYRWRLDGLDQDWRQGGRDTSARYANLQPGPYRFRVEASRGGARVEVASGELVLQPHFTQTPWFKLLIAAGVAALAWLVHWARTRRLLARSAVLAERNRLARDIHDGLTQSLTGILIQLEAALRRWEKSAPAARDHVSRASEWARRSLAEARAAVAALRQDVGSTDALVAALRRCGEALTTGTEVRLEVAGAGSEPLPPELGEALLRIGQEALTNALRHGKPGALEIAVEAGAGRLRLLVRDDGSGFDPPAAGLLGAGLRGMRERAAAVGATVDVRSRQGGPTEIEARAVLDQEDSAGAPPMGGRPGGPERRRRPWKRARSPQDAAPGGRADSSGRRS